MKTIREPAREIPVAGEYDVIVCGGGTAGFPAAAAAAREGANVALLERFSYVGGVPAYCIMPAWHELKKYHAGMLTEFAERIVAIGCGPNPFKTNHMEPEFVKKVALDLVTEAGVDLHLHTYVVGVLKEGKRVIGVITESKSGRRAFLAPQIIDATGDGDVAVFAGADYLKGSKDGEIQGMTVRMRIGGIDFERYLDWAEQHPQYYPDFKQPNYHETFDSLRQKSRDGREFYMPCDLAELYKTSDDPDLPRDSYFNGSSIRKNELSINGTRVIQLDGVKEEDVSYAEVQCRKQAFALWNFVRKHLPGFEHSLLIETAPHIGVRETRCIIGDYLLTEEDCRKGVKFEDSVALNPIGFDLHDSTYTLEVLDDVMVGVPFRCLLARGLDNVIVVGRCISTDHVANSSVRRMHTCFQVGQVGGMAAALAAQANTTPRNLPFADLKKRMIQANITV